MKKLPTSFARATLFCLALAATATVHAQAPATPAATTGATGATTTTTGTAGAAATPKPKPLGEADKRFFKEVSEAILFEQKLVTIGKDLTGESSKRAITTVSNDLKRIWEKLATLSQEKGATIAQEVSKSDASKAERISKAKDDKKEKDLFEDLAKETKKTAKLFDAKTLQDPDVKKFADDWAATIKGHETAVENAAKALSKKK